MAIEPLISFDGAAAFEALGNEFQSVIESLTNTVLENARANLGGDSFYEAVRATLQGQLVSLAQSGIVAGEIGSDAWQSWIAEWGSGSLIDTSNPDLAAYMGSTYWNQLRGPDNDITGRPKGEYLGLDGMVHESSGRLAGRSLEDMMNIPAFRSWVEENIGTDAFQPKIPLHFMRDAIESNRNLIINQLNAVIEAFSFGDFFV